MRSTPKQRADGERGSRRRRRPGSSGGSARRGSAAGHGRSRCARAGTRGSAAPAPGRGGPAARRLLGEPAEECRAAEPEPGERRQQHDPARRARPRASGCCRRRPAPRRRPSSGRRGRVVEVEALDHRAHVGGERLEGVAARPRWRSRRDPGGRTRSRGTRLGECLDLLHPRPHRERDAVARGRSRPLPRLMTQIEPPSWLGKRRISSYSGGTGSPASGSGGRRSRPRRARSAAYAAPATPARTPAPTSARRPSVIPARRRRCAGPGGRCRTRSRRRWCRAAPPTRRR